MKDLYSIHASQEDLMKYYEEVKKAYLKIFKRLGLEVVVTEASGGVFTDKHTHEFQVLAESGEDTIYYDPKTKKGFNKEIFSQKGNLVGVKAIEVGNIFPLGTKYAEKMGAIFAAEGGSRKPYWFGSYGIGVTRVLGALVEVFHDEVGIIWPEGVAPYKFHLIGLNGKGEDVYSKLGDDVLFDDREVSAGEKFADADLIGCPIRLVVSEKTGDKIEVKKRSRGEVELLPLDKII